MKNLKVWQKLAFLGVLFLIPFAIVTYMMVSSINSEKIDFAKLELLGTEYYSPLSALLKDLQEHDSLAAVWLNGDLTFKDSVTGKGKDIETDIAKVDAVDQRLDSSLHTSEKWRDLRKAIGDLLDKTSSLSASDSLEQHQKVIDAAILLISNVSDNSKLTLDPDIDTYYLMDVVMFQGPATSDFLAQARSLGVGMAARRIGTPDEFDKLNRLAILADFSQDGVADSISRVLVFNKLIVPELAPPGQATAAAVKQSTDTIRNLLVSRKLDANAGDYNVPMTKNIDLLFDLEGQATETLNRLLNIRIVKWQHNIDFTLAVAGLGLLAVSIIGFFIMRDITVPLKRVVGIANQIATGNLARQAVSGKRKDEIGILAQAFDAMIEKLSTLVSQAQKSGIQVNSSVVEIAATGKEQQATANETAATVSEIGATAKEITATARELGKTVDEVTKMVEQTAGFADIGQAGLGRMEETMRHIKEAGDSINVKLTALSEKAGNINQVVTTITKVADQTNLLSLNAAIEAEKAGEYGRGFSVVATEIRRLADQTAVAMYDIDQTVKEMQSAVSAGVMSMDKFSEEVRGGVQEIQQVSTQLAQIIQQVRVLTPRFETVNEGVQVQATGAQQISEALGQLSEAVQQTVESLRQSNLGIEQLRDVSQSLRSSVEQFKV
jgi:methyl-accepting chemotaxis protein